MTISAVCSGMAGMLGVAYFGSAQQNEFDTFLLDAIAAVVVGGTSLFGGRGGIGNTIVGLFVLGVLNNGLDYVKIDSFLEDSDPRDHLVGRARHQHLRRAAARDARSRLLRRSPRTSISAVGKRGDPGRLRGETLAQLFIGEHRLFKTVLPDEESKY